MERCTYTNTPASKDTHLAMVDDWIADNHHDYGVDSSMVDFDATWWNDEYGRWETPIYIDNKQYTLQDGYHDGNIMLD